MIAAVWRLLATLGGLAVLLLSVAPLVRYMGGLHGDPLSRLLLGLHSAAATALVVGFLLFGHGRIARWLLEAFVVLFVLVNIAGLGANPGIVGGDQERMLRLGLAVLLLVTVAHLHRAAAQPVVRAQPAGAGPPMAGAPAPGLAAAAAPASPSPLGIGLLVQSRAMGDEEIARYVADWGRRNPSDTSLAVASLAENGAVGVDLYATADGSHLWRGAVGSLLPGQPAAGAVDQIAALVSGALGAGSMRVEVAG